MYSVGWKLKGDDKETQSGFQTVEAANAFAKQLTDAAALLKVEFDQKPAGALAIATGHAGPTPEVEHVETAAPQTTPPVGDVITPDPQVDGDSDAPVAATVDTAADEDAPTEEAPKKKGWF
jgi:hypothetical protein